MFADNTLTGIVGSVYHSIYTPYWLLMGPLHQPRFALISTEVSPTTWVNPSMPNKLLLAFTWLQEPEKNQHVQASSWSALPASIYPD